MRIGFVFHDLAKSSFIMDGPLLFAISTEITYVSVFILE